MKEKDLLDEDIRAAFDCLNPTSNQKNKIKAMIEYDIARYSHKRRRFHPLAAAASVVLAVLIAGSGVNAATGGEVVKFLEGLFSPAQVRDDIVAQVSGVPLAGVEVYAPRIFEVSDSRIIFGTDRGIVVYDRGNSSVITTLDLMAIDCFFFNSSKRDTHVLVDEDKLFVYNLTDGVIDNKYYEFSITSGEAGTLTEYQPVTNSTLLTELEERYWDDHAKYFDYAFDTFKGSEPVEKSDYSLGFYSEMLYKWSGGSSIIYIDESNDFYLYTKTGSGQETKELIDLGDLQPQTAKLPDYINTGSDEILIAVKDTLLKEAEIYYTSEGQDTVCIPVAEIIRIENTDDETLVYGAFSIYNYVRIGNTLETVSGGSMPGLMHLIKNGDKYEVIEFEKAADGGDYTESVDRMCAPYPGLFGEFIKVVSHGNDSLRLDEVRAYVESAGLDKEILYYKDFGWDPVKLK